MTSFGRDIVGAIIIIIAFSIGMWAGATVSTTHADRERETAIANAISFTLESMRTPLNCKDYDIIETIKALALNGGHVKTYSLYFTVSNNEENYDNEVR